MHAVPVLCVNGDYSPLWRQLLPLGYRQMDLLEADPYAYLLYLT